LIAVLDASAAVRTVMDVESAFGTAVDGVDLAIAPELIVAEICSAFRKYVLARALSRAQAEKAIGRALACVDRMEPLRDLADEVLSLA